MKLERELDRAWTVVPEERDAVGSFCRDSLNATRENRRKMGFMFQSLFSQVLEEFYTLSGRGVGWRRGREPGQPHTESHCALLSARGRAHICKTPLAACQMLGKAVPPCPPQHREEVRKPGWAQMRRSVNSALCSPTHFIGSSGPGRSVLESLRASGGKYGTQCTYFTSWMV